MGRGSRLRHSPGEGRGEAAEAESEPKSSRWADPVGSQARGEAWRWVCGGQIQIPAK